MIRLADNLTLPLDFVTERTAFLARTGAGKSGGMRVVFEQFVDAGMFTIFVDPKGDAWGIRADGKGKGKPVLVIGGDHGDIPLEATGGKVIAEFLVKERIPTVLDLSDLSTAKMWRFGADFFSRLYRLNREVCAVFIDEVDILAGQQFYDPDCLHGIQLIQNKGRGRGFGLTLATQRPQILNKTVLNACGTLVAMQMLGDDALKVVKSWLMQTGTKEATIELLAQIPTLQTREAFVYSPQILGIEPVRITFAEFETFDSMKTPKPGEKRQTPKSLADIDLTAIERDMAATIEKAKADDPTHLRAEIARLKKELSAKPVETKTETVTETVYVPVVDEAVVLKIEQVVRDHAASMTDFAENIKASVDKAILIETGPLTKLLADLRNAKPQLLERNTLYREALPHAMRPTQKATPIKNITVPSLHQNGTSDANSVPLSKAEKAILRALFWTKNDGQITPAKIGFYADYRAGTGSFNNALSGLRSKGLLAGWKITNEGEIVAASYAEAKPSGPELREWLRPKIGKCSNEILDVLIAAYPMRISPDEIASHTDSNYKVGTGSFNNGLAQLRSLEAAEGYAAEGIKASDVFFE